MTKAKTAAAEPATATAQSAPSKRDQLLDMLRSPDGVSIEDMTNNFGWQPHSARAMLTGLRKAEHDVQKSKAGTVTIYKVPA